jgi:GNAT acetyltransferase-like protein
MTSAKQSRQIIRELDDGLVLRWADADEGERLADFNATVFCDDEAGGSSDFIVDWTHSLFRGDHPTVGDGLAMLVEDTQADRIASATVLIPQTWACEGIPFGVGRPEIVGTHKDYRRRGLVRAIFDAFHTWSANEGHLMQGITGIPWYYRQFGYEYALDMNAGRKGPVHLLPKLEKDKEEPFTVRKATEADIPFVMARHIEAAALGTYSEVRDDAIWRYELIGRDEKQQCPICIVESIKGEAVGWIVHGQLCGKEVCIWSYQLVPGLSYRAVTPSVMRYLKAYGEAKAAEKDDAQFHEISWTLGESHPVYELFESCLPKTHRPYAWYIRVADVPALLRHLQPVLERRLADSPLAGHTGELKVDLYRSGFVITIKDGRIEGVEPWVPPQEYNEAVHFPDLTFLHVLMGRKSMTDLREVYPDCYGSEEGCALVSALFPKKGSLLWGLM